MRFDDLTTLLQSIDLPSPDARTRPPRDRVRDVQNALAAGLAEPDFALDCLERDFAALASRGPRDALTPFYVLADYGVRIALAYWAPGVAAGAHEHNDWTVTAVLHNALEVETFDWDIACRERRLVKKNRFGAERGRAGHIYDPCIHNPLNPTSEWSISIHLFGPNDGPRLAREVGPITGLAEEGGAPGVGIAGAAAAAIAEMDRERAYRAQVAAITRYPSTRALAFLEAIYDRGDAVTKRAAASAIARLDAGRGARFTRASAAAQLHPTSELARNWSDVPLTLHREAGRAALVFGEGRARRTLVRTDAWAEAALAHLADAKRLSVDALPGDLTASDRLALCDALVGWGVFRVVPAVH